MEDVWADGVLPPIPPLYILPHLHHRLHLAQAHFHQLPEAAGQGRGGL